MIVLRRLLLEDAEKIFKWRNDPEIYKWCRQVGPLHWNRHLAWLENQSKDPSISMFMILDDGIIPVGVCGLTSIDSINRRAEFSLYIGSEYQRMGYATQALKALFKYGFNDLNLNRIWGETFHGNPALDLFMKKLYMDYEGIRKDFYFKDGYFVDTHLISLSAESFKHSVFA